MIAATRSGALIRMTRIPYKGSLPTVNALVSAGIHVAFIVRRYALPPSKDD